MPREFPNPPVDPELSKKLFAGNGREIIAYKSEGTEDLIFAYYKDGEFFSKNPVAQIRLSQTLFVHQILTLLFPENFPEWLDAGINRDGYVASVRKKVIGVIKEKGSSVQLKIINELFKKYNLQLSLDLAKPNIFFHENVEKYTDSAGIFVKGSSDIEKLEKLMLELGINPHIKTKITQICRRILVLEKLVAKYQK